MTRLFKVLLLSIVTLLSVAASQAEEPTRLQVLSCNFHHGEEVDRKLDLERIARGMLSVNLHVVAMQEVNLHATPESRTLWLFEKMWTRANEQQMPTVPVSESTHQSDCILCRPNHSLKVVEVNIVDEAVASDHRTSFAVLEIQPERD